MNISIFKRLNEIFLLGWKNVVTILVLLLASAFFEIIGIALIIPVFSNIEKIQEMLDIENTQKTYIYSSVFLMTIYALKALFLIFAANKINKFIFYNHLNLGIKIYRAYLTKNNEWHEKNDTSKSISGLVNDLSQITNNTVIPLLTIAVEGLIVFSIICVISYYALKELSLIVLVFTIFILGYKFLINKKLKRWGSIRQKRDSQSLKNVRESFFNIKEVILGDHYNYYLNKYKYINEESIKVQYKQLTAQQVPRIILEFMAVLMIVLIFIIQIEEGVLIKDIIPTLVLFGAAAFRVLPSLNRLFSSYTSLKYSENIIENYFSLIKESEIITTNKKVKEINFLKLRLNNLNLKINNINLYNNNVNLLIKRNDKVAIIGESGSGKTTLLNIISSLKKIEGNEVLINDQSINECKEEWRKKISYLNQQTYIQASSIRENVAYGLNPFEISDDRVWECLRLAKIDTYVNTLNNNLYYKIGEHGTNLSGGQKQRIGLARCLYKQPEVILLDEPTSALDENTAEELINNILSLSNLTIILITHNISIAKKCNVMYEIK